MTEQEREQNYNAVFKHPILGRVCALAILLTIPVSIPLILTIEAIANGETTHIAELWDLLRWNDEDKGND